MQNENLKLDLYNQICLKNVQQPKVIGDTWKKILLIEKIIMSQNGKYYVKSLKRNKVKFSDIRGL